MMERSVIGIEGMHCAACERTLETKIGSMAGVGSVRADCKKERIEVAYDPATVGRDAIEQVIAECGYGVCDDAVVSCNAVARKRRRWAIDSAKARDLVMALGLTVMAFVGYGLLVRTGIVDRIAPGSGTMNIGVALMVGIVASLSSCLAVVGGVVIAFGEKYRAAGKGFYHRAVLPNMLFHGGRLATFFVLGGVLGTVGGRLSVSGMAVGAFDMAIAVIMLWLGLNILGFAPSIARLGISMPKRLTGRWDALMRSERKLAPLALGGLSFFLPCGFTQSMQIFALASGSALQGATVLFAFALGTTPVLLLLGVASAWAKNRRVRVVEMMAGLLLLVFAVYTFNAGWAIKDVSGNVFGNARKDAATGAQAEHAGQTVTMRVSGSGFEPDTLRVKRGVPVRWVVDLEQVGGCTDKIVVPSLGIDRDLVKGENIIVFTPETAGEIPFSCWMGMVRGKFLVE